MAFVAPHAPSLGWGAKLARLAALILALAALMALAWSAGIPQQHLPRQQLLTLAQPASGPPAAEPETASVELTTTGAADPGTQVAFSSIYDNKVWGQDGKGSGAGSSVPYTTRTRALVELLACKLDLAVWIDAPCGAMAWMPLALQRIWKSRPGFKYIGLDIVGSVIAANKEEFKDVPSMSFLEMDFSKQPLPAVSGGGASAIFTRDALQHLPYDLIASTLENFVASSATYLIAGSYTRSGGGNQNIPVGGVFFVNLLAEPFNLPAPYDHIEEETPDGKELLVWKVEDLKNSVDFKAVRARMGLPAA